MEGKKRKCNGPVCRPCEARRMKKDAIAKTHTINGVKFREVKTIKTKIIKE